MLMGPVLCRPQADSCCHRVNEGSSHVMPRKWRFIVLFPILWLLHCVLHFSLCSLSLGGDRSAPFKAEHLSISHLFPSLTSYESLLYTLPAPEKLLLLRLRPALIYGYKYLEGGLPTCLFKKTIVVGSLLGSTRSPAMGFGPALQ